MTACLCALLLAPAAPSAGAVAQGARPAASSGPSPGVGATGAGDPYFPLDGNGGIDVLHYDVAVDYRFDRGVLSGVTTLRLRALRPLAAFHLDLLLPVRGVTVDGTAARWSRPSGAAGAHELRVRPARPLAAGEVVEVRVAYAGRPATVRYAEGRWFADRHEVVAMGQPHGAPWWFAANDHPSDKAGLSVAVTGPAELQAVSNGLPAGQRVAGAGGTTRATTRWRSPEPMAPYLAFFALGRFRLEQRRLPGPRPRVEVLAVSQRSSPAEQLRDLAVVRRTDEVVGWLERRLGPYPFAATGALVTSLDTGFALETQTRPVYPAGALGGPAGARLLVHELAHQWFGDHVSVRRWRDVWLNEGLAEFAEVAWAEAHGGPSGRRWLRARYREATGWDPSFWRLDLTDPGPRRLFASAVYLRGAMAVQALRDRVGEERFWRLLRTWLHERGGSDGTLEEFRAMAERVTGQPLDAFFTAWLEAPQAPADTAENGLRPRPAGSAARRGRLAP